MRHSADSVTSTGDWYAQSYLIGTVVLHPESGLAPAQRVGNVRPSGTDNASVQRPTRCETSPRSCGVRGGAGSGEFTDLMR